MEFICSYLLRQWAIRFLLVLFLAEGFAVFAVGVNLLVGCAGSPRQPLAFGTAVGQRRG